MYKKIIPYINCENELSANFIEEAVGYEVNGADELFVFNYSSDDASKEEFLDAVKELTRKVDIRVMIGCYAKRFEDIKKALYTGAAYAVVKHSLKPEADLSQAIPELKFIKEASERFGTDKIYIEVENYKDSFKEEYILALKDLGVCGLLLKHVEVTQDFLSKVSNLKLPVILRDSLSRNDIGTLLEPENVLGVSTNYFKNKDLLKAKLSLKNMGVTVNTFESSISFKEFKLNSDGMIPVVVQDYKSSEVLMVAYMNEEAFQRTIETGKMTYYSRSRNTLWIKGETSGHYQYVKKLKIDCDKDTILAKVSQVGPACHTGSTSCFYTDLVKKEYDDTNPLTVFNDVFQIIIDRKKNPKEGSYTNYLFDKGIDKILKKCGEEATEIVIAAKNPNSEELKYEISDFLYHMMVLMAECNLDWSDIVKELAHRR